MKQMKKIQKIQKIQMNRDNGGYSLVETLLATLILLFVTGIVVSCIALGQKRFDKNVRDSEAQLLAGTLSSLVESELHYAKNVRLSDETDPENAGNFNYYSVGKGLGAGCYFTNTDGDSDGRICIYNISDGKYVRLVTEGNYTYDLKAYVQIEYNEEDNYFDVNLTVGYDDDGGFVTCMENDFTVNSSY